MLYKILIEIPGELLTGSSSSPSTVLPLIPLDLQDGFIHLSTESQVKETLNTFFSDFDKVYILHVNIADRPVAGQSGNRYRSTLKWEWVESRKELFPHLYGDLLKSDVVKVEERKRAGNHW